MLQEDETRYYATAVVSKTNDLKLATVSWPKSHWSPGLGPKTMPNARQSGAARPEIRWTVRR